MKNIKHVKQTGPVPVPKPVAVLLPDDVQEYRLRAAAMQTAQHNALMVSEAYQAWIKKTLEKYGLQGKYNLDLQTGHVTKAE